MVKKTIKLNKDNKDKTVTDYTTYCKGCGTSGHNLKKVDTKFGTEKFCESCAREKCSKKELKTLR